MKGLEFYSAAAQIIPLLLILLAFQAQSFARISPWQYPVSIVLFAFVGEIAALSTLYSEERRAYSTTMVVLSLLVLSVLVFLAIVLAPSGRLLSIRPPRKDGDS